MDALDSTPRTAALVAEGPRTAVFTICSNNYMPFAKVLMASVRAWHPEAELFVCLADTRCEWEGLYDGPFEIVEAAALGIADFQRFAFQYDIMEFNTAVKPFMFQHLLLQRGFGRVFYFDPDICLYARIDPLLGMLDDGASLLLTPHLHAPAEADTDPSDITIMRAGIFNLGFLGASNCQETRDVIRWWMRRLRMLCVNQQRDGIFVDQKFMDLVPGFAPSARIVHDRGVNLAYWNLGQAELAGGKEAGWTVEGRPLRFFHFSGFDPRDPGLLSKHTRNFRGHPPPPLAALTADYARRLLAAGYGTIPAALYAYGRFASGAVIPDLVRRMFRDTTPDWPQDPFETYEAYLHQEAPGGSRDSASVVLTHFLRYLWHSFDNLRLRLDLHDGPQLDYLVRWYVTLARREQHLDHRLIEPVAERLGRRQFTDAGKTRGGDPGRADVSVIGYLRATSGVGTVARHTLAGLAASPLMVEGVDVAFGVVSDRSDRSAEALLRDRATGRVQIFANVNADQLPPVLAHLAPYLDAGYRIGMPAWELEEFPEAWLPAFDGVDEIWAQTAWTQRMLAPRIDKPVIRMPVRLTLAPAAKQPRAHFGLPEERFLFYFAFDFLSFIERKNPYGAIEAFRTLLSRLPIASRGARPMLVIKTMNGHHAPGQHGAFMSHVAHDPDIAVVDEVLTRADTLSLLTCCDCALSLHRCEGLGLLIAEAMALGVPVVATDYAATTELLSARTGYPVAFRMIDVRPGEYPMGEGQRWADPDTAHAAWLMSRAMDDPGEARRRAANAAAHIAAHYGSEAVLARQLRRLAELDVR